jgi:hypothetical protein
MKNRPPVLLLCALLLLVAVAPLLAQDETYGLSASDYTLLNEANTALGAVTTLQFDYSASMAISGIPNASGTLNLEGSGALIGGDNPSMELTFDGQTDVGGLPVPLNAEMRIVDGILYVNVSDPTTGQLTGWRGQSLEELGGVAAVPAAETTLTPELLTLALAVLQPEQFVFMRRELDETAAGHEAAHFIIEVDVDGMFNAPFMEDFIAGMMETALPGVPDTPTASELASLLEGSTFQMEEWVGLDDRLVHRTRFDLVLNIHPRALGVPGGDAVLAFNFDITLDQFDETVTIVAPEDAVMLTTTTVEAPVNQVAPIGTISANTPTTIQLSGQAASDFTYAALGTETITVTARSVVASTVDTTLEVISPSGQTLAFNDDRPLDMTDGNLGTFDSAVIDLALPEAGAYVIRVGSYNNTGFGEVEVVVTSDAPVVAVPIVATSEIVLGALSPGGVFTYAFAASEAETLTIAVRDVSGTLDPHLLLMDSHFVGIAENDDHASTDAMLDPLDAKIEDFIASADGLYHVIVSDVDETGGLFQLVIIRGGGLVSDYPDIEPIAPPIVDDPNAIRLGDTMTFLLDGTAPGTRTFYGAAGQQITITASAINPADIDVFLTVFDADGTQIAFNDDHGTADSSLGQRDAQVATLMLPTGGAYRIEVDSWFDLSGEVAVQVEEG